MLDSEDYDVGSDFDAVTNNRFDIPVTGYYLIEAGVSFDPTSLVANKLYGAGIKKNNTIFIKKSIQTISIADGCATHLGDIAYLEAGDYIELFAIHIAGVDTVDVNAEKEYTHLTVHLLSR